GFEPWRDPARPIALGTDRRLFEQDYRRGVLPQDSPRRRDAGYGRHAQSRDARLEFTARRRAQRRIIAYHQYGFSPVDHGATRFWQRFFLPSVRPALDGAI